MIHINSLPLEALVEILLNVEGVTVGICRRVCKKWKECIDSNDRLWEICCRKEYRYSSFIAKRKCGDVCKWYHIYKNLIIWSKVTSFDRNLREFYVFSTHDKCHMLDVDYSVLPLRDTRGIVLYDTSILKYIPVVVPERNCIKIANSTHITVTQIKSGLFLLKTTENSANMREAFFKADKFVLNNNVLYYCNNRDVYRCDTVIENLTPKLLIHCDYDIKEIQYFNGNLHIFTDCGKIVTIAKNQQVVVKPISCPPEWVKQIKHICAIDDKNFVCYSRTLFKIETDKYQHLYLEFPTITALFFYGDFVLIGTRAGEILLYRLSSQKHATKPIFENLAVLPEGKYAVQLDIVERPTGPVIIVATFFNIMVMEINFFPHEKLQERTFGTNKLLMYKRLLKLKERLQSY